jgi:hypothetical protein
MNTFSSYSLRNVGNYLRKSAAAGALWTMFDDWYDDGGVINYLGPMAVQSAMASIFEDFVGKNK